MARRTARPTRLAERPRRRAPAALAWTFALAGLGCSQHALVALDDVAASDAATYDTAPFDGPGFVDGRLHTHAVFNTVEKVYWFGGADDPSTLEIYVYEQEPTCDDVSKAGWLTTTKVRPGDLMGITIGGHEPGVYQVSAEKPPAAGHAYLMHIIDQTDPVIESEGLSGSVTITSVTPNQGVSGAFAATFSTGTLDGAFNAAWCPTGVGL